MKVISIGYGRHLFTPDNIETKRMLRCAEGVESLDMIIFTKKSDNLETMHLANGLTLHPTNSISKINMIVDAFFLGSKLISTEKHIDVVTTQDPFEAGLVGFLLKLRYKIHVTMQEHGDVFATVYWKRESKLNFLRYYLGRLLLRYADTIRVVSKRTETFFQPLLTRKQSLTRLPVAVDVTAFTNTSRPEHQYVPGTPFTFISAARFVPQKNLTLMIDAFALAYTQNPLLRLKLIGEGKQKEQLEAKIKKLFPGTEAPIVVSPWSNNLASELQQADAYLLTSNYEGWARVLIEALSAGLPIVTTDVGCVGEVVLPNVHGLVVPINEPSALTSALVTMSTNTTLYQQFVSTISALDMTALPGTNVVNYGTNWRDSLK